MVLLFLRYTLEKDHTFGTYIIFRVDCRDAGSGGAGGAISPPKVSRFKYLALCLAPPPFASSSAIAPDL